MKYLILISIVLLASCNPCKYVSKHPECFPADTIRIVNDVVHYEKVFITNDSIILDTVPCDPITKTYYKTETVYKTKTVIKTDTIYTERTTTKINPANTKLQADYESALNKLKSRNKAIFILIIIIIGLLAIYKLIK